MNDENLTDDKIKDLKSKVIKRYRDKYPEKSEDKVVYNN